MRVDSIQGLIDCLASGENANASYDFELDGVLYQGCRIVRIELECAIPAGDSIVIDFEQPLETVN